MATEHRTTSTKTRAIGYAHVGRHGADVVEVTLKGYVDALVVGDASMRTLRELDSGPAVAALIDATDVGSFAPDMREAGTRLLERLRSAGVPRILVVSSDSPVRMVLSAIAFASATPIEIVDTREIAAARLREARGGTPTPR